MKYILYAAFTSFLFSCKSDTQKSKIQESTNDFIPFFPVKQYLDSQIHHVNTTPYFMYKVTSDSANTDSSIVTLKDFNTLATSFTNTDITDKKVKKYYKESVFHDLSTQSIVISYTTYKSDLIVQKVDVLLDDEHQKVKRIFIDKKIATNDSIVFEKLGWKANESFSINRIIQTKNRKEYTQKNTIVWNEKKE